MLEDFPTTQTPLVCRNPHCVEGKLIFNHPARIHSHPVPQTSLGLSMSLIQVR